MLRAGSEGRAGREGPTGRAGRSGRARDGAAELVCVLTRRVRVGTGEGSPNLLAFMRRRNPIPTKPRSAVGTARKMRSPLPEDDGSRAGKLMASMVEPAELSGCVGLGADAVVVGAEVESATKPAPADPAELTVVPKPLELKSGELWVSEPEDTDGYGLKGATVVADPAAKSGSAAANKRD